MTATHWTCYNFYLSGMYCIQYFNSKLQCNILYVVLYNDLQEDAKLEFCTGFPSAHSKSIHILDYNDGNLMKKLNCYYA